MEIARRTLRNLVNYPDIHVIFMYFYAHGAHKLFVCYSYKFSSVNTIRSNI